MSTQPLAHNLRRLGHLDLPGGGQVVVEGDHAYHRPHEAAARHHASSTSRDPTKPRVVAQIELADDDSHTHKVRVVGDLMYRQRRAERAPLPAQGAGAPGPAREAPGRARP